MKRLNVLKVMFLVTVAALFYVLNAESEPASAAEDSNNGSWVAAESEAPIEAPMLP